MMSQKTIQSSKVEISGFHYIVTHKAYDGGNQPNRPPFQPNRMTGCRLQDLLSLNERWLSCAAEVERLQLLQYDKSGLPVHDLSHGRDFFQISHALFRFFVFSPSFYLHAFGFEVFRVFIVVFG